MGCHVGSTSPLLTPNIEMKARAKNINEEGNSGMGLPAISKKKPTTSGPTIAAAWLKK